VVLMLLAADAAQR